MFLLKKKLLKLFISLFLFIFTDSFVFGETRQKDTSHEKECSKHKMNHRATESDNHRTTETDNHRTTEADNQRAMYPYNHRTIYAYNGWAWIGVGFLFEGSSFENYIDRPTMDYQIGVAKSFWNITPYTFLYLGLIFDFAYSKKYLSSFSGSSYNSYYYFSNEQLLAGYEQNLGGASYLSAFAEAGVTLQQRYFLISQNPSGVGIDYLYAPTFGGTFNGGLNIQFNAKHKVSYLFRLAMNLMIGNSGSQTLNYSGDSVQINKLSYAPSVSFGVRM